jgi:hypothetical protein
MWIRHCFRRSNQTVEWFDRDVILTTEWVAEQQDQDQDETDQCPEKRHHRDMHKQLRYAEQIGKRHENHRPRKQGPPQNVGQDISRRMKAAATSVLQMIQGAHHVRLHRHERRESG